MLHTDQVEELISVVSGLDREELLSQFRSYRSRFPLDFSEDFLRSASLDRLKHIFVAVCLQHQRMPELAA